MADDREVYEQFVQGDLGAFELLFRAHQREVYGWIFRIVRDPSEAEELTVEAFWRLYVARARFDPSREFGAWARRIATNVALNRLRSLRSDLPLISEPEAPREGDPVERRDLRSAIEAAMAELPPRLRLVATLALIEELPYRQIAEALGLGHEAVKSRVFRAVRKLRKSLQARGITP